MKKISIISGVILIIGLVFIFASDSNFVRQLIGKQVGLTISTIIILTGGIPFAVCFGRWMARKRYEKIDRRLEKLEDKPL